jgi:hypothetical protein
MALVDETCCMFENIYRIKNSVVDDGLYNTFFRNVKMGCLRSCLLHFFPANYHSTSTQNSRQWIQWLCLVVTTWVLVFGARVRRHAGKKGSSVQAPPSVFYLFHKHPQQMKLCMHPLHSEFIQHRYNTAWMFQCEPSTNHALPTAVTYSVRCSASNLSESYNIPYFLPLKTHFLFTSNICPQRSAYILHWKVKGY